VALPLLSEVFYDATGSGDGLSFVEIFGAPDASLDGWAIEGLNGSNGAVGPSLLLSGVVPVDGVFVVADSASGGGTSVANADPVLNFDLQNGPDSVVGEGSSTVHRRRTPFSDEELAKNVDSVGVRRNPALSSP